jgi:hypothetical protein
MSIVQRRCPRVGQHRIGRGRFEALEQRLPLAGNVTAQVSGGTLLLFGDGLDNSVSITGGANAQQYIITGVPSATGAATTINGQAAFVANGVRFSTIVNLRGGNDTLSVADLVVNNDLNITMDTGNDTVLLGAAPDVIGEAVVFPPATPRSLQVGGALIVNTGTGNDTVDQISVAVRYSNVIDTGPGNDSVFLGPDAEELPIPLPAGGTPAGILAGASLIVNLGDGNDFLTAADLQVGVNLHVNDPLGVNDISITEAFVEGSTFLVMGSGQDFITLDTVRSDLLHINTLGGNDDVSVVGANTDRFEVFLGAGNDRLEVGASRAAVEAVFDGGPGSDIFADLGGNFFNRQRRYGFEQFI